MCTDGEAPFRGAGLVQATDGNFYGTTPTAGANASGGTVYKITPSGRLTTLYSFCSQSGCTDGAYPNGRLVQATDGNFYGITNGGGAVSSGTVFKITPSGALTTLYSFCAQLVNGVCADGSAPEAGLVQASDGDFYGTTSEGGANFYGTAFKITPGGALTTLYSFCAQSGCTDGSGPDAGLVQATDGNFYGTTPGGGANNLGTVFKITPGGALTTQFLRDNQRWRGLRGRRGWWDDIQNHAERHANDPLQLLRPKRLQRRQRPPGWASPGRQRGLLRDNV